MRLSSVEVKRWVIAFLNTLILLLLFYSSTRTGIDQNKEFPNSVSPASGENPDYHSHINWDPAFNLDLNPNKTLILILAAYRSGSTFLGNLFDKNPTMQYMFEPFYDPQIRKLYNLGHLIGARHDHTESDLRMLYLQQILHNCTAFKAPFPEKHGWCGTPEEHLQRFNTTECVKRKLISGKSQEEICRYRNITVIKIIRLPVLSDLLKIAKIKSANLKIIHLLRHPSALMMSRRTAFSFFMWDVRTRVEGERGDSAQRRIKVAWEAFNYCYNHLRSIELVESDPWFKERYMRVTHLEMSLRPLEAAEKVYDFIGETLTDHIKEHIINITGAQSEGYLNRQNKPIEVYRNSTDIASAWKKLKSSEVRLWDMYSIEAQCKLLFEPLNDTFVVDNISLKKLREINSEIIQTTDP